MERREQIVTKSEYLFHFKGNQKIYLDSLFTGNMYWKKTV